MPLHKDAVDLLEKVIVTILEEPRRLEMAEWGTKYSPAEVERNENAPPCGTQGCIAGWVRILGDKTFLPGLVEYMEQCEYRLYDFSGDTADEAMKLLHISINQAERLFYLPGWSGVETGWPREFATAYRLADTPAQKAEITARRIRHFITTGGEE